MSAPRSDQGFIIRLTPLTETSLILHWMTQNNGLLKTVAKGARRPKSPFSGKLDLFLEAEISWSPTRNLTSGLHTLRELDVLKRHQPISQTYHKTLLASYFCKIIDLLLEPEHPAPELHNLLSRGLHHLHDHEPTLKALRHFENQTAQLLGIANSTTNGSLALLQSLGYTPKLREKCLNNLK